jgi:hypothetical protein
MQYNPVGWHLGKAKAISIVGNQEGMRPEIFSVVWASNPFLLRGIPKSRNPSKPFPMIAC